MVCEINVIAMLLLTIFVVLVFSCTVHVYAQGVENNSTVGEICLNATTLLYVAPGLCNPIQQALSPIDDIKERCCDAIRVLDQLQCFCDDDVTGLIESQLETSSLEDEFKESCDLQVTTVSKPKFARSLS